MEYRDGRIHGFKLKFKKVSDDTERYMFALVDLLDEGKIQKVPGKPLIATHYDVGHDWIIDCYFEHGLYDELENHLTPQGEVFFGPICEGQLEQLERLRDLGETVRVRRVWRAHVGLLKSTYWFYVKERNRGFKHEPKIMNVSEDEQRASHNKFVGRIAGLKKKLLPIMADYRKICAETGASPGELAAIDADIEAITAEQRRKPEGKPDKRAMTEDVFWELIERGMAEEPIGERLEKLSSRLALFKPAAIRKFDLVLRQTDAAAYRTDVWALAYLLQGGCSDDSFDAFRGWLIMQGREVFEGAISDPNGFEVSLHQGTAAGMDALRDAAPLAYDLSQGKPMRPNKVPPLTLAGPNLEEDAFAAHLPKIAAAVGWAA